MTVTTRMLELGCGTNPRVDESFDEYHGIDAAAEAVAATRGRLAMYEARWPDRVFRAEVVRAGYERLPFDDDTFDLVIGDQFLEHVPRVAFRAVDGRVEECQPVIDLLNEVCRVARATAAVRFHVPKWDREEMWQDPTHVNPVPPAFWKYWDPDDPWSLKEAYGIRGSLRLVEHGDGGWYDVFVLQNVK